MGMYTELDFAIRLRKNTPNDVLDVLRNPLDDAYREMDFLKAICSGGSYYFEGKVHRDLWFDDITDSWHFQVKTNCKNYNNEIQRFIEWLAPWMSGQDYGDQSESVINGGDVCGYIRYEEQVVPDIILDDGRIYKVASFKLERTP